MSIEEARRQIQEAAMEINLAQVDRHIAATLAASLLTSANSPDDAVRIYSEVLAKLRE